MSDLDESFEKLLGRQPTDKDRQDLYRVRDALGLKNNDALWLVLMALQHYQGLYERFPEAIASSTQGMLRDFKSTADASVKASAEAAKADLAQAVATASLEVAKAVAGKDRLRWLTGSIITCGLVLALFGWYMHSSAFDAGYRSGYAAAYGEAKDQKAAAAWANTPQGKAAYKLAKAGHIDMLEKCNAPGWHVEGGICYPGYSLEKTMYGWRMY